MEQDFWFSEPLAAMTVADGEVISVGVSQAVARDASSHQVKGSVGRARFAGGIHASESGGIYTWSGSYHAFSGGTSLTYVSTGSTPGGAVQGLTTLGDYLYATDAAALYVYEIPCATSDVPSVPVTVDARGLLAYPNPSSGGTWFSLPAPTVGGSGVSKDAVFEVFGSDGCLIRSVPVELDGSPIRWDGLDDAGRRVPSGTVWVRVQTATSTYSTRVQILR
ncbi:MAG: hypothetical protein R3E12_00345 [Candidatus Eisenbacteria bacterium]